LSNLVVPEDIKELRQSLSIAKEDRVLLMNKLGELVYYQSLNREEDNDAVMELSQEILLRDRIIYAFSSELTKRITKQGHCTNCQQPILKDVKFCGKCGTLNAAYESKEIVMRECAICESTIPADVNFCPCCGIKQEG